MKLQMRVSTKTGIQPPISSCRVVFATVFRPDLFEAASAARSLNHQAAAICEDKLDRQIEITNRLADLRREIVKLEALRREYAAQGTTNGNHNHF